MGLHKVQEKGGFNYTNREVACESDVETQNIASLHPPNFRILFRDKYNSNYGQVHCQA